MSVLQATEIVAEATRRALDQLADMPPGAELRMAVVLLDVSVPDPEHPDDPGEAITHTIWKCAPAATSASHAYGVCATAAHGIIWNRPEG